MTRTKDPTSPYLLLSITMMLWGSACSGSKSVVEHVPQSVAAFLLVGGAAPAGMGVMAYAVKWSQTVKTRRRWTGSPPADACSTVVS